MTTAPDSWRDPSEAGLRGGDRTAGRRLASLAAACCLAVLAAGCGISRPASLTRAPAQQGSTAATTASRAALRVTARTYLAIARPANRQLDRANDGYTGAEHGNLTRAAADLRSEVATERHFDQQLLRLPLPSTLTPVARALVRANQSRIELTIRQARATSLGQLRALDHQHQAADAAVETQVRLIRTFLRLPPPSTS
jgi:hypothetical protein